MNEQATTPDSGAGGAPDRDPVHEVRDHLEHALNALEFLRATLSHTGAEERSGRACDSPARGE